MTFGRARHAVAAALVVIAIGAAGFGCPSRDLAVEVTDDGIGTVILACESLRGTCDGKACERNKILCDQATCKLRKRCEIEGNPEWDPTRVMGLRLLLTEARAEGASLKRKSKCIPLNLRPCLLDPTGLLGCPGGPEDGSTCVTAAVMRAVTDAIGGGLTFDGFDTTDDVLLTAAIFQKRSGEASCEAEVTVSESDCAVDTLVAAAGLAAPLGASIFDITCASCQGGPHASLGRDNGACPVADRECFLVRTAALLAE